MKEKDRENEKGREGEREREKDRERKREREKARKKSRKVKRLCKEREAVCTFRYLSAPASSRMRQLRSSPRFAAECRGAASPSLSWSTSAPSPMSHSRLSCLPAAAV